MKITEVHLPLKLIFTIRLALLFDSHEEVDLRQLGYAQPVIRTCTLGNDWESCATANFEMWGSSRTVSSSDPVRQSAKGGRGERKERTKGALTLSTP